MITESLTFEAEQLGYTAEWRDRVAKEFPDDPRNLEAATLCRKLADELMTLKKTPLGEIFELVHAQVFNDSERDTFDVTKALDDYRSRIGFDHSPQEAGKYLVDAAEIILDTI